MNHCIHFFKAINRAIVAFFLVTSEAFAESYICFPEVSYPEIEAEFILPFYDNGDEKYNSSLLNKEKPSTLVMRFPLTVNSWKFTGLSFFYGEVSDEVFGSRNKVNDKIQLSGSLYWSEYNGKAHSQMQISNAWDKLSIGIYYGSCGPKYSCKLTKENNKFDFQCAPPKIISD